ncbi:MAG: cation:proton antiporter [Candidatus Aenigmarchaeota archaeon]|nr:cation:proton antiporter [Candidatus Aenigmarchaeota archaeon]
MIDAWTLVVLIGVTVLLGYIGNHIFSKTKIPDVIWLIIFGLVIAYFNLIPRDPFIAMSAIMASIALFIILFDSGLNIDFFKLIKNVSRSVVLAVLGFVLTTTAVALFTLYFMNFSLLQGLLLGAILGGTCSTTVVGIIGGIRVKDDMKTLLSLESILTDPITIIVSMALIGLMVPIHGLFGSPIQSIVSAFSIGIVVGLFSGILWLFVLDKIKNKPFDYMVTLGVLFLVFAAAEFTGGSGAIAALFFGIVLGNGKVFSKMLRFKKEYSVSDHLKKIQAEITFFIRAFFFVFLGLVAIINITYLLYGLGIAAVIIIARFIAVRISIIKMDTGSFEKKIAYGMAPRGLASAVLAQLALTYQVPGSEIFASIIFIVIFTLAIYTSLWIAIFSNHASRKHDNKRRIKL